MCHLGSSQIAEESLQTYYSQNYFRVAASFQPELLARQTDPDFDPDGGVDPKQWVRRIGIMLDWDGEIERRDDGGQEDGIVVEVLRLLSQCDRLEEAVLEIPGPTREDVRKIDRILQEKQQIIRDLDRRLQRGVPILREQVWDRMGRCTYREAITLPWWSDEKERIMDEVISKWNQYRTSAV